LLVDLLYFLRGFLIFCCKLFLLQLFKGTLNGLGNEPASPSGLDIPRKFLERFFREADIDTNRTHCISLIYYFIVSQKRTINLSILGNNLLEGEA